MRDPLPGIKPEPSALGGWSLTHWTTREVPSLMFLIQFCCLQSLYRVLDLQDLSTGCMKHIFFLEIPETDKGGS